MYQKNKMLRIYWPKKKKGQLRTCDWKGWDANRLNKILIALFIREILIKLGHAKRNL